MLPEETQRPIWRKHTGYSLTMKFKFNALIITPFTVHLHHGPHVEFFFQFWGFQNCLDVHIIEIYTFGVAWKGVIIHVYECTLKSFFFLQILF